ncbi:MAG: sulfur carrier protein ThiS [Chloroflexi bacterium]|nr:sulfur carrier protein ThiS [Chloroflexota bacterium]
MAINLVVNGQELQAPEPMSVLRFLEHRNIQQIAVAVAHNGSVLHRDEYATVQVNDGDRLEIVRMVGGG